MKPLARSDLVETRLLRNGHVANARVYLAQAGGRRWTVKDFSDRPWWVRFFVAPLLLRRELAFIRRLKGVEGVAQEAFLVDANALAIAYQEGEPLKEMEKTGYELEYLRKMEALMLAIHARGVAHMDARGTGNWIVGPGGEARLIDFQASLSLNWMPKFLRRAIEAIDISGVYNKWQKAFPETMTEEQKAELAYGAKCRSYWIFHGYGQIKITRPDGR